MIKFHRYNNESVKLRMKAMREDVSMSYYAKCWFDYKTVVVSGASSGIGKGLVKRLINDHCCNVIGIARNENKMKALVEELGEKGDRFFTYRLFDVSVEENWKKFADELSEKGIIPDVIINNAGILPKFDKFLNYSMDDINRAMQINFYSCVYSMRAMVPIILNSPSAALVNVASSAALCALAGTSIYSASKSALKSMTDAVREEYRGRLYVGLVCPGFTKTDIFHNQKEVKNSTSEKALQMVSTDCDKMVDMIIEGMWKKKSDMVFGSDAKMMDIGTKLMGVGIPMVANVVMKLSKLELFEDIYSDDSAAVKGAIRAARKNVK